MIKVIYAAAFTIVGVNAAGHDHAAAQLDDAFGSICDGRVRRDNAATTLEDVTTLCTLYTTCVANAHGGDRLRRAGHEGDCSDEKTACCDAAAAVESQGNSTTTTTTTLLGGPTVATSTLIPSTTMGPTTSGRRVTDTNAFAAMESSLFVPPCWYSGANLSDCTVCPTVGQLPPSPPSNPSPPPGGGGGGGGGGGSQLSVGAVAGISAAVVVLLGIVGWVGSKSSSNSVFKGNSNAEMGRLL